ncbi:MAG: phosphoenolpyruvate synthase [Candidatus Woesearchaeota archaeon]|jgi:pyruvate,water dikinase|nr:phosphoenolpyruvate synthase [Candidatus Woesearchaeota archaeon]
MDLKNLVKNLHEGESTSGLKENKNILWFEELGIDDIPYVGGKNASLGEMYVSLSKLGVKVPYGFAVTANAYNLFVDGSGVKDKVRVLLSDLNTKDLINLQERGRKVRAAIMDAEFPEILKIQIIKAYRAMEEKYGKHIDVAVRSSATAEDLPDASFAGQQETYLNVHSDEQLLHSCKKCFASLFTDRAISYRVDKDFDHFNIALSIGVQKMVRSDLSCSGVMFSIDTESGFDKVAFITGAYGLGENVVQGAVNPDEYIVFKPTLEEGYRPIISKTVGEKHLRMVYDTSGSKLTKNIPVSKEMQEKFVLKDDEVLMLAKWAIIIEDHYSAKKGHYQPMDMEWAKDGQTGELFIVQARPETVQSRKDRTKVETYEMVETGKILVQGVSVGSKIGHGQVKIIHDIHEANNFEKGDILVTDMTDPDWEPIMKKASAIITNRGGRTCHAAIISREMGVPAVVGCSNATTALKVNSKVTVSCAGGEVGYIFEGFLKYKITEFKVDNVPETKTKIMLNLGNPHLAFSQSFLPNDGVGLAREEFIINSGIQIHPNALLDYANLKKNPKALEDVKKIEALTKGYDDKVQYYVDKLAEGVATIAAAFYPKKVIIRLSDFKSNEYANLIGGRFYEPVEDNPMIGFRGASRYYSPAFKEAFKLEIVAMKKVREEFGLKNIRLMIPFCRTVTEAKKVLQVIKEGGLERGKDGLEIYLMCEIPSNVILADQFLDLVDGYSLGTNDLTQLTLGLDRDSELVSHVYDERDQSVKDLVAAVINKCNERGKYIGICGQAPSDYPEFAEFVVEAGIQTMSLNPDTVVKTKLAIAELEHKLAKKPGKFNAGFQIKSSHKTAPVKKKAVAKKVAPNKVVAKKKVTKVSKSKKK